VKNVPAYDDLAAVRRFVREPERAYGYDEAVADRLRERIVQAFGARVRRVILFGSRVRGDALPDSDYDVLVVLTELVPEEWRRTVLELYKACRGSGVTVEPHPMSELEFEETKGVIGGLAYPAAKEGVILYENA
jgi:predicted nucleotidyltransferase